jgi:type II secretory pathway component GspD/PulD (secretin)
VVIEARFVEVGDFEGLDFGIEFPQFDYTGIDGTRSFSTVGSSADFGAGSWTTTNALTQINELNLLGTIATSDFNVQVALRALSQKVNVNTLSAPKITCLNNQRANIRIATSKNFVEKIKADVVATTTGTTTSVDVTVETALEGVSLDVTPTINLVDDTITLELHPSVVSVDLSDTQQIDSGTSVSNEITLPEYVRQTIDTNVTIPDGGTVILGGLIRETEQDDIRKVPFLGDVPILGNLFRYKTEFKDKTNLLIFITAHILNEKGLVEYDDLM